ncbi:GNAT family N-acetyltransferase [Piscibacillus salipiscarius]|uniref:GNAT family N-acetyltransferase n=1 Tax=Piscibacillus salipiscarius TaxID=299480 RepID=UPI0034E1C8EA
MIDFGFNNMKLVRVQALCFEENINSERVMQKVGMSYEGTMTKRFLLKVNTKT